MPVNFGGSEGEAGCTTSCCYDLNKYPCINDIIKSVIVSRCVRQSSTEPPLNTNQDIDEIDNLIKARNKDLPMPDMTNPYEKEQKQCILCKYNIKVDYKNTKLLSQFVSQFTGKVYHKRITGLCQEQQARVEREVKLSKAAGYMPFMFKDLDFIEDPKLFDLRKK